MSLDLTEITSETEAEMQKKIHSFLSQPVHRGKGCYSHFTVQHTHTHFTHRNGKTLWDSVSGACFSVYLKLIMSVRPCSCQDQPVQPQQTQMVAGQCFSDSSDLICSWNVSIQQSMSVSAIIYDLINSTKNFLCI